MAETDNTAVQDMELTPELQEKLKGFLPITVRNTFEYVPKIFRSLDPKYQPVFIIKPSNQVDKMFAQPEIRFHFGKYVVSLVKTCVISWRNWRDVKGKEIPYSSEAFNMMPEPLFLELANAAEAGQKLEQEEKQGL